MINKTGLWAKSTVKIHSRIKSDFPDGSRMRVDVSSDALYHCGLSPCLNQRAHIS